MKPSFFSAEILDTYYQSLVHATSAADVERKSKTILEWLYWLYSKELMKQTEYEEHIARTAKLTAQTLKKIENKSRFQHLGNFKISTTHILLIILIICIIFIFKFPTKSAVLKENSSRTLSYVGKLLDPNGQPITEKKDLTFKIYSNPTTQAALYTGKCIGVDGVVPDYKGNFTIVIGADCGMERLPLGIFQDNAVLYLGVQVGSNPELKPRKKISTSGYSQDTEQLQGRILGGEKGNIPFIDGNSTIKISAADPVIQASTGTLQIDAQSLLFKTTQSENSSIIFQPQSNGNTIIGTGKLAVGTFTPVSLFTLEGVEPYGPVGSMVNLGTLDESNLSVLDLHIGTPADGVESAFVNFYAETTKNEKGTQVGAIRLNNEGVVYETAGADFAEYFDVDEEDIPPGYAMSLSTSGVHRAQKKEVIVGVTSDTAGFVGNRKKTSRSQTLIALQGQVELYVTDLEGSISRGDAISASQIPGWGVKQRNDENIIGYALSEIEKMNCPDHVSAKMSSISCGKLKVFLK